MAEHLQPREPGAPTKASAAQKPVLSRYARRAEAPVVDPDVDGERKAERSARVADEAAGAEDVQVVGEGVEISARSPELPAPPDVAEPGQPNDGEQQESGASAADDGAVDGAALPDGAATGSTADADVEAKAPALHGPPPDSQQPLAAPSGAQTAARVAPESAPAGAERVRRVEASEVDDAPTGDAKWASSVVPVHSDAGADHPGAGKKLPFWKRIALPLVQGSTHAQGGTGPHAEAGPRSASLEPVLARLNALEKQLAANQVATENQLTRFEENITQLWELEEQLTLTEVRERLALLEANQEEIADGLHTVGRNLTVLAVVLAAALAAGLLSLGLLL